MWLVSRSWRYKSAIQQVMNNSNTLHDSTNIIQGSVVIDSVGLSLHFCYAIIGRAKRAPHWDVQLRFRVIYIYIYICRSVCLSWAKMRRRN